MDDEGIAAVIETCPSLLTHEAVDVLGAFKAFTEDAAPSLAKVGVSVPVPVAVAVEMKMEMEMEMEEAEEAGERGEGTADQVCAWGALSDEAKDAAMRAAVDFAGRVAEPCLRRARVMKDKKEMMKKKESSSTNPR